MALYTVTNLTNGTVIPPPPFGRTLGPHQAVSLSARVVDAENDAVQTAITKGLISVSSQNDPAFQDDIEGGVAGTGGIGPGGIGTTELADDAVTNAKMDDDAVDTAELADGAVEAAKAAVFVSTEQTATGSAQNIAHGLGVAPAIVFVSLTNGHDGAGSPGIQVPDIAEGAHDTTNVVLTVTAGATFKVMAWA